MDNFAIDITAEGEDSLKLALQLCLTHNAPGGKVEAWTEKGMPRPGVWMGDGSAGVSTLILLWSTAEDPKVSGLPSPAELDGTLRLVLDWLASQKWGRQPDHDGSNGRGWRVFVEDWGHISGYQYAVAGIQPAWAMYGK